MQEDIPQLLPVHRVVCLLQVDEGGVLPPLLASARVHLLDEPGDVGGCRGGLFEARLVLLGGKQVWRQLLYLRQRGLLQDLGQVRSHHDWSDVFK